MLKLVNKYQEKKHTNEVLEEVTEKKCLERWAYLSLKQRYNKLKSNYKDASVNSFSIASAFRKSGLKKKKVAFTKEILNRLEEFMEKYRSIKDTVERQIGLHRRVVLCDATLYTRETIADRALSLPHQPTGVLKNRLNRGNSVNLLTEVSIEFGIEYFVTIEGYFNMVDVASMLRALNQIAEIHSSSLMLHTSSATSSRIQNGNEMNDNRAPLYLVDAIADYDRIEQRRGYWPLGEMGQW